ncbi:ABC transporter permease, partial [Arthrobacter sp. 2YAF22_2]|uniref:ABC transporter permease n=1 Tax=Arthrobacter sp. 2YAF22_2 TaxID=3233029 RepID=UPI003F93E40F
MTNLNTVDPAAVAEESKIENSDVVIAKSRIILRRFLRNKTAVAGLVIFVLLTVLSLIGGTFSSWDKETIDSLNIGMGPSAEHLLGTSQAGIDLYALTVEGTRVSILIGLVVGLVSVLIAAVYGCTMAYFGGKVDKVMLFVLEALIMMPALLVVAVATSGGGEGLKKNLPSWLLLIIVLLVFSWMGTARLIRSLSMSLMQRDFVKAAQYMGIPARRIVWRHLVPNIGSLLVLDITRGVTGAILAEVAFSFIGIGIKVPDVSLGV